MPVDANPHHNLTIPTRRALFLGFLEMGLSGFGGVLPWARRVIVEKRRWLSAQEFTETLSVGQILPGPNIVNVSIAIGHRFHGFSGSLAAFTGLILAPLLIVILLGIGYSHFGELAAVRHVFVGVAAAAAGLLLSMGIKMAMALPKIWQPWLIAALAFIGAGLLRIPLLMTVGLLAPLSLFLMWRNSR